MTVKLSSRENGRNKEQGVEGGKENIQTEMKNSLISPHPKGW
jgi:hypothetical protein